MNSAPPRRPKLVVSKERSNYSAVAFRVRTLAIELRGSEWQTSSSSSEHHAPLTSGMVNGQRFTSIGRMPKKSSVSLYLSQFKEEASTSILFHHTQLTLLLAQLLLFLLHIHFVKTFKGLTLYFVRRRLLTGPISQSVTGKEWLRKTRATDKALSLISQLIKLNVKVLRQRIFWHELNNETTRSAFRYLHRTK